MCKKLFQNLIINRLKKNQILKLPLLYLYKKIQYYNAA